LIGKQKRGGELSSFSIGLAALGFLNVPKDKNKKNIEVRLPWGPYLEICFRTYFDMSFFTCLGVGPYPLRLIEHFRHASCRVLYIYKYITLEQLLERTEHLKLKECAFNGE
jgi:hypothetical protein